MKRILIPSQAPEDWKWLLAKPELHWRPGRSAMSCALAWELAADRLPPRISEALDASGESALAGLELLAAVPEWQVALPGGTTTSNTDVMAFCSNAAGLCVMAVEAKVDESFGPLLGEKRRAGEAGAHTRIKFLEELLHVPPFGDEVRYQLLHRTASAVLTARAFHAATAVMLVQAFGTPAHRQDDFHRFLDAARAIKLNGAVWQLASHRQPRLYLAWVDDAAPHDI